MKFLGAIILVISTATAWGATVENSDDLVAIATDARLAEVLSWKPITSIRRIDWKYEVATSECVVLVKTVRVTTVNPPRNTVELAIGTPVCSPVK